MSKYTTEVRYICERAAGLDDSVGYNDVDNVIESAIPSVFNFDFPIFDENYRNVLCTKILRHYYTREIGFETVGLWKLKLQTTLNEIMPFYNQLYDSELIKFNPLYDVDLKTTHVGDKSTKSNTEEKENIVSASNNERTDNETISKVGNNTESGNKSETHNEITDTVGNNNDIGTIVKSNSNTESSDRTENIGRENVEIGSADASKNQNAESKSEKVNASDYRDSEDKLHYDLYSDTPQGALTGVDNETYLTNARKVTDENSKHGNSNASEIGTTTGNSQEIDKSNTTLASNGAENVNENVEKTSKQDGVENENKTRDYTENSQAKSEYTGNNETTIKMDENQIRSNNTLDNANRTDAKSASADSKIDSTESYLLHVVGKNGGISYSKLLKEFRETFLNIDLEIIRELSPLFMNLW